MRASPEKRERLRRLSIHTTGRLGEAFLTEVRENVLHYTYRVRGVQYEASQDVSALRDQLPSDPDRMIGMVGMKYLSKNPANSILICEEWSGLREPSRRPDPAVVVAVEAHLAFRQRLNAESREIDSRLRRVERSSRRTASRRRTFSGQ